MAIQIDESEDRPMMNSSITPDCDALAVGYRLELIKARRRAGLSQSELAKRIGTIPSVVARLESGQRMPSIRMLLRIAKATGNRLHLRLTAN